MRRALFLTVLLLAGCQTGNVPVAPAASTVTQPIAAAVSGATAAQTEATAERAKRDSQLAASLELIGRQNDQAPASPQQIIIAAEQTFSMKLIGAAPTAEDRAAAAERENLMLAGRVAEARKLYAEATTDAEKRNAAITRADAARDAALVTAATATAEATRKLDEQQAKHEADTAAQSAKHASELAAANKRADDIAMVKQVRDLNIAGAGCLLLFAVGVGFGGIAALTKVWPLGFIGLLCFGLAQIVSQWWFKWAALGCIVAAIGVAAWWVWRHLHEGDLKAAADQKAAKFSAALGDIVPALDRAYDEADHATRDLLDRTVFSKLSDLMDKATKQTIHEVRATPPAS